MVYINENQHRFISWFWPEGNILY